MNFFCKTLHYMTQNVLIRLIALLGLIFYQGCSHTTGPILSESVQKDLQRIGIVVKEGESLEDSRRGWLSSMGAGAARGSVAGEAGILCGWGAFICIPVLAAAGAIGGSVYGLYQASSETLPTEVESLLGHAITVAGLSNLLVTDLVANAKASGYSMEGAKNIPLVTGQNQEEQQPAHQSPFDTLLEIEGPVVNLLPATFEVDPPRRVGLSARVQVIRTADQEVLADQIVLDELGDIGSLEEWMADQGQHFREELPRASRRLSEKILIDFFMRYDFEERTYAPGMGAFFDAYAENRVKGLRSLGAGKPLESLRPTMRWETFTGEKVTYDLRIWESTVGSRTQVGAVVYSREGLTENDHTLETSLSPATTYTWSVRARFVQNGKVRVTEWSKAKGGFTIWCKISSFGVCALMELAMEDWGFYQIHTPAFIKNRKFHPPQE
jgi:hypothetical protein